MIFLFINLWTDFSIGFMAGNSSAISVLSCTLVKASAHARLCDH